MKPECASRGKDEDGREGKERRSREGRGKGRRRRSERGTVGDEATRRRRDGATEKTTGNRGKRVPTMRETIRIVSEVIWHEGKGEEAKGEERKKEGLYSERKIRVGKTNTRGDRAKQDEQKRMKKGEERNDEGSWCRIHGKGRQRG
jgi:hypothetical protein